MICPIKNHAHLINPNANKIYTAECNKECALWDEVKQQCCLKTLSQLKVSGGIDTHTY